MPTSTDVAECGSDLELAEAEALAAEAEAAAARARADAARARARAASLRSARIAGTYTSPCDSDDPEANRAEPDPDSQTDLDHAAATSVHEPIDTEKADGAEFATSAVSTTRRVPRARRVLGVVTHRLTQRRRMTKRGAALLAMGMVTVAALAATVAIGWHHRQVEADRALAADFTAAAERGVTAITSLDFENAKRDVQRIVDQSTGEFRNDFTGRAEDFTSVIEQSKVTTNGEVTGSAVESLSDDSAVVLVSARSDVTNAAGAEEEPRTWRLRVTVTDDGGTKKISKVDFVP
ncbi:hypothetical protein GIY30_18330 [Gordonia sp. HNM0687]|uniref:Mce-associated membrane protein n=1 Tax=Gordonia mangrovi TaxID=2665643 RepID=A0A6L7GV03_9ACTN|nr:hypothetical protein [Gordonia mangrovi]MXP23297.1 hypothetical protein [Gordonia mangrovi]UVF76787.1 hypothetical protein NWF22_15690 [Gordonia mangrovi]